MSSEELNPLDTTMIRPATSDDAQAIAAIYNYYIDNTQVTFETEAVTAPEMSRRIGETAPLPWLVAEGPSGVIGYAYASKWRTRHAYRFSVETTVYLRQDASGRGIGSRLYGVLLDDVRARGVHTAIGGIALPNQASVALHEKLGFVECARFNEVGFKFDRWVDVGYWQLLL
jgi:L-amino acid N-acyltransferase YncA